MSKDEEGFGHKRFLLGRRRHRVPLSFLLETPPGEDGRAGSGAPDETQVVALALAEARAGQLTSREEVGTLGETLAVVQAGGQDTLDLPVGQEEGVGLEAESGVVGDREAQVGSGEHPRDPVVGGRVAGEDAGDADVALSEGEDVRVVEVGGYREDKFRRESDEGRRTRATTTFEDGSGGDAGCCGKSRPRLRFRYIFLGTIGRTCDVLCKGVMKEDCLWVKSRVHIRACVCICISHCAVNWRVIWEHVLLL